MANKPKRIRRMDNVSTLLTKPEHQLVQQAVDVVGMTKSSWIRMVVVNSARAQVGISGGADELMVNAVVEALQSPELKEKILKAVGAPARAPADVVKAKPIKLRGAAADLFGPTAAKK